MFTGDWRYDQDSMPKPLDLAGLVDPDLRARYIQATDIRYRGTDPPAEWAPRIAAEAEAWAERTLAERLHSFDTSDLAVANEYLGINSSWDLESWKRETEDWPERLAELRRRRDDYERDQRLIIARDALAVASATCAEDETSALGKAFDLIVRASLVKPGCVVRATASGGRRRTLDWAELRAAIPDIPTNTLTIGGVVFSMVQVEMSEEQETPERSNHDSSPPKPRKRTQPELMADWIVGKGSDYLNSRSRSALADDFKNHLGLRVAPSNKTVDRAKSLAFLRPRSAPTRAK